jgi:hypothetical protein
MNTPAALPVVAALSFLAVWHYRRSVRHSSRTWPTVGIAALAAAGLIALTFRCGLSGLPRRRSTPAPGGGSSGAWPEAVIVDWLPVPVRVSVRAWKGL